MYRYNYIRSAYDPEINPTFIASLVAELSSGKPRGYDEKTVFDFLYENPRALGGIVIIVRAYRLHPRVKS